MPRLGCKNCLALHAGTIARTCAATGVGLHLVGPLGFEIDSSRLKRAGLDYWPYVAVNVYSTWQVSLGACGLSLNKEMTRQCHLSHTAHQRRRRELAPCCTRLQAYARLPKPQSVFLGCHVADPDVLLLGLSALWPG